MNIEDIIKKEEELVENPNNTMQEREYWMRVLAKTKATHAKAQRLYAQNRAEYEVTKRV